MIDILIVFVIIIMCISSFILPYCKNINNRINKK